MAAPDQAAFVGRLQRTYTAAIAQALADAVQGANTATAQTLQELGRVIQQGIAPQEFLTAHQTIGLAAQRAVLNSYAQVVTARKRVPSYRTEPDGANTRFAGGKLKAALSSPRFFVATPTGIQFINVDELDATARHWARLNAGAGAVGGGSRRTFDVRWSNLVVASLGLEMSPSPAFLIPRGYWWDAASGQPAAPGATGTSEFYPLGTGPRSRARATLSAAGESGRVNVPLQRRRVTGGIVARNFLDAGVARIATDLGPTYQRLYSDFYSRGLVGVRPARSTYHVTTHRVNLAR